MEAGSAEEEPSRSGVGGGREFSAGGRRGAPQGAWAAEGTASKGRGGAFQERGEASERRSGGVSPAPPGPARPSLCRIYWGCFYFFPWLRMWRRDRR